MIVTARDVYGDLLPSSFTAWIRPLGSGTRRSKVARDIPPSGRAEFVVRVTSSYRIRVVCEGHVPVARNVGGAASDVELTLPVDPSAVVGISWPDPWPEIPGIRWGDDYPPADIRRRGTLLNIWAKMAATSFGLSPVAAFVEEVLEVRVDRIICRVSPEILPAMVEANAAGLVEFVSTVVGHEPPDGYEPGPGVKTFDERGNLQVSIFRPAGDSYGPLLADVDIDEERGFRHAVRAVGHHITHGKTDAVTIQQILAAGGIDAGWRPRVA